MSTPDSKYDVAFSFKSVDLNTARRLADLIQPLTSFVYAERQEEIVTKDGAQTFGPVFDSRSRLNVVLYSVGYGETGWTGFERNIIIARCLREGWRSFAMFKTDESPRPVWVPETYIYGDLTAMDLDAVAGVIRYRAREAGADVRQETAADRLRRLAGDQAFNAETEVLATTREAFESVERAIAEIFGHIAETIKTASTTQLPGESGEYSRHNLAANLGHIGAYLHYRNQYGRVTGGELLIRFFDGPVQMPGRMIIGHPEEIARFSAKVIRTPALQWCWQFQDKAQTSLELVEFVLNEFGRLNASTGPKHFVDRL
jgi:hypothetical protein